MKNERIASPSVRSGRFMRLITFAWIKKTLLVDIISIWFVILFMYTGIAKFMEFGVFKAQLEESPVMEPVAPVIAWGLPILEFIISVFLFVPRLRLKGLYGTFLLMTAFTIYVLVMLLTSPELPCSCGGIIEQLSWPGHLIFNTLMVILSVVGIRLERFNIRTVTAWQQEVQPVIGSHA